MSEPQAPRVSIGDAIKGGWNMFTSHLGLLLSLAAVMTALSYVPQFLLKDASEGMQAIVFLIIWIVQIFLSIGIVNATVHLAQNKPASWSDIGEKAGMFFKYLGASILYALIVMGGMILLIVPGVIWALKYQFYSYAMVDRNLGVMESLHESGRLTQGVKLELFGLAIIAVIFSIIGAALFGIGLLVVMPVVWMAYALVYVQLMKNPPQEAVSVSSPTSEQA